MDNDPYICIQDSFILKTEDDSQDLQPEMYGIKNSNDLLYMYQARERDNTLFLLKVPLRKTDSIRTDGKP